MREALQRRYYYDPAISRGAVAAALGGLPEWILRADGQSATLDIDFVNDRAYLKGSGYPSIASLLTCTRASTGYYTKADGTLVSFLSNVLRYGTNGLLVEEARTNLCLQSQTFDNATWAVARLTITANAASAPDGTTTADAIVEDGTLDTRAVIQNLTVTSGQAYAFSMYAQAGTRTQIKIELGTGAFPAATTAYFNLTGAGSVGTVGAGATSARIEALANGWYRCTIIATANASSGFNLFLWLSVSENTTYQGVNGTTGAVFWGAQLEAGAFATSYIPTTTTSVTRAADDVRAANISWLTQGRGTIYVEVEPNGTLGNVGLYAINDGSSANTIDSRTIGSSDIENAGATQAFPMDPGNFTLGSVGKFCLAYDTNDMAAVINGSAPATDVSGTPPSNVTQLQLGALDGGVSGLLNGDIRRFSYWNSRLPNASLQTLTA